MIEFNTINANEKGKSVRDKLNKMLSALISGREGSNALWWNINALKDAQTKLEKNANTIHSELNNSILNNYNYIDQKSEDLRSYVNTMVGGIAGFAENTSYSPDFPLEKSATVFSVVTGTFTNMLDVNGNPITIEGENAMTVFFKESGVSYWKYQTLYINPASSIDGGTASSPTKIQLRGDTLSNWLRHDPILKDREIVLVATESAGNYNAHKIGDGAHKFSELTLITHGSGGTGGSEDYLSSVNDDTAKGFITFEKGIRVLGEAIFGVVKADSIESKTLNVTDKITTKDLEVTGTAHFFELVIDKVRSVGGRVIISCANCKADYVEYLNASLNVVNSYDASTVKYFRVYFAANDGETSITNSFVQGDFVIHQTFNIGEGASSHAQNRYYWRRVMLCSYEAKTYSFDSNQKKYYSITLANTENNYHSRSNAIPQIGDDIVQLGHITDKSRASAIILSAYNDAWLDTEIKAPLIAQYLGICTNSEHRFELAYYRHTHFALNGNEVIGNLKVITESGVQSIIDFVNGQINDTKAEFKVTTDEITSKVSETETRVDDINSDLGNLHITVAKNTSAITQTSKKIDTKVTELSNSISEVDGRVDAQDDSILSLGGEIGVLQDEVDKIPLKTDADLTEYTGNIAVTSRKIALEVSEISNVRRNLFAGTQFWLNREGTDYKVNGSGATLLKRTFDRINEHNALEVISTSASASYPGICFLNVKVEPAKKYTISAWVKRISDSFGNGCHMIVHYRTTTDQNLPSRQESVEMFSNTTPLKVWQSFKYTITPQTGENFVNVIFCVGTTGTFRIAEPMMEQSDDKNVWSPSEKDYAFICGNKIPDSDTLRVTSSSTGITIVGDVNEDEDEGLEINVSKGTVQASYNSSTSSWTPGAKIILSYKASFEAKASYVFSFYAKRSSEANENAWISVNFGAHVWLAEYGGIGQSQYASDGGGNPQSGYMEIKNVPTEWTRYWVHVVTNVGTMLSPVVQAYIKQGELVNGVVKNNTATFLIKKPKLEYSAVLTEWTTDSLDYTEEDMSLANQLHKTGINITKGLIELNAKNTIIDGNLHLRGVLVENYAENTDDFIICDMIKNKSVSVGSSTVVLPMINNTTIKRGTSKSYVVSAVKEAGVKLTIAAKYNPNVAKWATGTSGLYTDSVIGSFHEHLTTVIADPRIASYANYASDGTPIINPLGGGGYGATNYEGGVFVCNGRRGRVLLLMPGQILHLTSAIEQINGKNVLLWYVDNSSDFMPIRKKAIFWAQSSYTCLFTTEGGSAWPMELGASSGSEYMECMFGASQLSAPKNSNTTPDLDIYTY